ncbi:unnamed protein product [Chrysoparadoxa australica]
MSTSSKGRLPLVKSSGDEAQDYMGILKWLGKEGDRLGDERGKLERLKSMQTKKRKRQSKQVETGIAAELANILPWGIWPVPLNILNGAPPAPGAGATAGGSEAALGADPGGADASCANKDTDVGATGDEAGAAAADKDDPAWPPTKVRCTNYQPFEVEVEAEEAACRGCQPQEKQQARGGNPAVNPPLNTQACLTSPE